MRMSIYQYQSGGIQRAKADDYFFYRSDGLIWSVLFKCQQQQLHTNQSFTRRQQDSTASNPIFSSVLSHHGALHAVSTQDSASKHAAHQSTHQSATAQITKQSTCSQKQDSSQLSSAMLRISICSSARIQHTAQLSATNAAESLDAKSKKRHNLSISTSSTQAAARRLKNKTKFV